MSNLRYLQMVAEMAADPETETVVELAADLEITAHYLLMIS